MKCPSKAWKQSDQICPGVGVELSVKFKGVSLDIVEGESLAPAPATHD